MSSKQALIFGCLPCRQPRRRPGLTDTPVLAPKLASPTHGTDWLSKIILLLLLLALHLGMQPHQPCQPGPRRSWRSCGRNVRALQHPATARLTRSGTTSQPPMNSSSYQVIRTQFTLYLTPKTFIASITLLTLLAHPTVQLPASSHSNHHIIFNPIGTIAAKMSYIHVTIPIYISSIQHQLDSFTSYVERFTNLNTTHNNKLHFARVIQQLATFALNELNHGRDHFRNLDTLLPEDISDNPRHKRFIEGIIIEVCKKDYHFQKSDLNNCREHLKFLENQLTLRRSHAQPLTASDIPSFSYMHPLTKLPVIAIHKK
jgi:hypothetical protein